MKVTRLTIEGLLLVELDVYQDDRGFFIERFQRERFHDAGVPIDFVQDNHSRSKPGVLRGLHYQHTPPQGKLLGVMHGRIWDVAVDIRPGSPTFGQHEAVELSDLNGRLLWMPPGFAHGFCVLGDEPADLLYRVDGPYNPRGEGGIAWDDPDLAIPWPIVPTIVSDRDRALQSFAAYQASPAPWALLVPGSY
ncbi:MAG: dTDP-4-dehydrorhamnose 3,5-epimerase [Chloroflexota bacterium]